MLFDHNGIKLGVKWNCIQFRVSIREDCMGSGVCHKQKTIQLRLKEGRNSAEEVQQRQQGLPSCGPWVGFKSINLLTLHTDLQRTHNFMRFFRGTRYPKKVKNLQCAFTGHDKSREEKGPSRGRGTEH